MAYIDREAFAEKIKKCSAFKKFPVEGDILQNVVLDLLGNQPAADVEEVKHSRWENISGFDVFNICGTSPAYCEPKPNNPKGYPPYCHHCGAKMDGRRTE